jgi:hypothetical protein
VLCQLYANVCGNGVQSRKADKGSGGHHCAASLAP